MGRPTTITDEISLEILTRLAEGTSLVRMCKEDHLPDMTTIYRRLREDPEWRALYTIAKQDCSHTYMDMAIEVAEEKPTFVERGVVKVDPGAVQRNRLRVHTLHTAAARLNPKAYGEKLQVGGAEDLPPLEGPESRVDAARRIAFLFAQAEFELRTPAEPPAIPLLPAPKTDPRAAAFAAAFFPPSSRDASEPEGSSS